MAKKIQLHDEYGNDRYPITTTDCVVDADGNVLSAVLEESYHKPSDGIPKSDLASGVQASLEKADTALQEEKYTGTITEVKMNGASKGTSGLVDLGTVITAHQDISGKADKSSLAGVATSGSYNDLKDKPTIPAEQVNADWNATSGKAQILNKPTIPSAVTESTVSGWGFTKNTGTVTGVKINNSTKSPSSGTVDIGNVVTSVKINGSTKSPSSGVVDLGTVITSHQDISGKQDKLVSGTNIKTINNQSILGSGNITISGGGSSEPYVLDLPSLVSSLGGEFDYMGNVQCSGTVTSQKMSEIITAANNNNLVIKSEYFQYHNYDIIDMSDEDNEIVEINVNGNPTGYTSYSEIIWISLNVTTSEVYLIISYSPISGKPIFYENSPSSMVMRPNTYNIVTAESPSYIDVFYSPLIFTPLFMEEYFCEFTIPTSGATVYLPEDVKWANDETPVFKNGYTYQISIVNGLGIVAEFKK